MVKVKKEKITNHWQHRKVKIFLLIKFLEINVILRVDTLIIDYLSSKFCHPTPNHLLKKTVIHFAQICGNFFLPI